MYKNQEGSKIKSILQLTNKYKYKQNAQVHQINPTYFSGLVLASDCPDKGYRIPFFLLAFGIIGVFTAIMNFFSNSLWSEPMLKNMWDIFDVLGLMHFT
jgi:hypothetical protein